MGRPKVRDERMRERLLGEALRLLEADGPAAIRARTVARAADTSTGALYELFGDKTGLVRALFYESFAALDARQEQLSPTGDPRADVEALLATTRGFAVEHPMLFDLMFGRPFEEFDPSSTDTAVGRSLYRRTVAAVDRWLATTSSGIAPKEAAGILVAAHRGLVAAELAGTLGRSPGSRRRTYDRGVSVVLDGIAATGS